MSDSVSKYWVSAGCSYAGPDESQASLAVLSLCIGAGGPGGGRQWLIQPPEVVFSDQYLEALARGKVTRDEAERHGKPAATVMLEALTWLNAHAYDRPPILLSADGTAGRLIRRFFIETASYDPFAATPQAVALSEQWSNTIRYNLEEAQFMRGSASAIAETQFEMLVAIIAQSGWS